MMVMQKPGSLLKPTVDTLFHIDYIWWERADEDLRTYLISHLLPEQRERLSQIKEERIVDFIDPETGEVTSLDELGLAIRTAAEDPDFINSYIPLVDSVFRVFLKNGNQPLSPRELADYTGRPAATILKTLFSGRIYKGIRPV
jgi:hypothetical protein